jgi:hypothetical protein
MDDHQKFVSYAVRVFSKTSEALPACRGNDFMMSKVASSIDRDKVKSMEHLVKSASAFSNVLKGAQYGLGGALGVTVPLAAAAYLTIPSVASAAASSVANAGREEGAKTLKSLTPYLLTAAGVLGLGGASRAGLLGDTAQDYTKSITDSLVNIIGSNYKSKGESKEESRGESKEESKGESKGESKEKRPRPESPMSPEYKLAAAKTFCSLTAAKNSCTSPADLEKISQAQDECGQILFDCIFYL